jgi:hypothetical protein
MKSPAASPSRRQPSFFNAVTNALAVTAHWWKRGLELHLDTCQIMADSYLRGGGR